MEPEDSLAKVYSQEEAIGSSREPDESNLSPISYFSFNILPFVPTSSEVQPSSRRI
jgi:hypothetical protein